MRGLYKDCNVTQVTPMADSVTSSVSFSVYISLVFLSVSVQQFKLPGLDLHRRQWSLLNRFRTGQGTL